MMLIDFSMIQIIMLETFNSRSVSECSSEQSFQSWPRRQFPSRNGCPNDIRRQSQLQEARPTSFLDPFLGASCSSIAVLAWLQKACLEPDFLCALKNCGRMLSALAKKQARHFMSWSEVDALYVRYYRERCVKFRIDGKRDWNYHLQNSRLRAPLIRESFWGK